MDCFVALLLAMTKGGREVIMDCFALLAMTKKEPSLRGFEKAVAISLWDTGTIKQNSSLREPIPHIVIARTEGSWQSINLLK